MYPGIPEYINRKGRGMYSYLTGSASWFLLTMLTEVFGIRGHLGDLVLEPKLVREQFDASGKASVSTLFADRRLNIVYHNPTHLDYGQYEINEISIDGRPVQLQRPGNATILPREVINALTDSMVHCFDVTIANASE